MQLFSTALIYLAAISSPSERRLKCPPSQDTNFKNKVCHDHGAGSRDESLAGVLGTASPRSFPLGAYLVENINQLTSFKENDE